MYFSCFVLLAISGCISDVPTQRINGKENSQVPLAPTTSTLAPSLSSTTTLSTPFDVPLVTLPPTSTLPVKNDVSQPRTEVFLQVNESASIGGSTVRLVRVVVDGRITVNVDGVSSTFESGVKKQVACVYVTNKRQFYDSNEQEGSAEIILESIPESECGYDVVIGNPS